MTHYPGGYQYYLDKTKATSERAALTAGSTPSKQVAPSRDGGNQPSRKDLKRLEAEARQAKSKERKARQDVVSEFESEILALEERQKEIVADLENQATYEKPGLAAQLNRELVDIQDKLTELNPK
ncbi:hypothetical protein SDC9_210507 [bioreactor metagenome]|uniref:ABC transporter Uup C-terminal domain-containing protein n=1 Tax=bioreactor metagenome TaxID=1076179 RepID=A0A645JRG5_9ZZZZ